MESDDDFEQFSHVEASATSPTLHRKKLKRLKKASTVIHEESIEIQTLEIDHLEDSVEPNLESELYRSASKEEENDDDLEWDSGFEFNTTRTKRLLDFDVCSAEELGFDEDGKDGTEMKDQNGDLGVEILEKKKRSCDDESDGSEENEKKKKKKTKNNHESDDAGVDGDDKQKSHVTNKRRTQKERRENLAQLRSESQRLLRETRDATFKPMPLVKKSISSVLEKIRQRKQEVSKKSSMLSQNKTSYVDDFFMDREPEKAMDDEMEDYVAPKAAIHNTTEHSTDPINDLDFSCAADKAVNNSSNESIPSPMGLAEEFKPEESKPEESKQEFRAPINDTEDLFSDSQTSDSDEELPEETPKSPTEEVLAPSLLAMDLKFDSAPPEDISDGENNENIDPQHDRSVDTPSSPNGDPVKNFLDDEAEEEDDSDNDLMRFKDADEDEDGEDLEELKEMIATGYKEKPIDSEKRNELHQKWLEQQDAAGTEKVLQKLKCGGNQMETILLEDEDDESSEDDDREFNDEKDEHLVPRNIVQINLRKAKQMISQMFTDKNDAYISSDDDEETETRQVNLHRFEKHSEATKHISPAKEDQCRNVVIKKMNVAPNTRDKVKRSSLLSTTLLGGSRNVLATKPSFLGRGSHPSIPSSKRHGSSKGRSFIFERDDSNSSSAISKPEESFDTMQREHNPTRTGSAKYRSSQSQSASQVIKATVEVQSGPSLHEILRHSSWKSTQERIVCHTEAVFSAFKLEKKPLKKEPGGASVRS